MVPAEHQGCLQSFHKDAAMGRSSGVCKAGGANSGKGTDRHTARAGGSASHPVQLAAD